MPVGIDREETMENNEKLLEAARTIQEHCESADAGSACPFAIDGVCNGIFGCTMRKMPIDWKIPNRTRWTPADKALAAGLKANGYNSVTRAYGSESVLVLGRSQTALELGKDFFESLACNEVVNLDDIAGEG